MNTQQRTVHSFQCWSCVSVFALLSSSAWAADPPGINPGLRVNPQLAKEVRVKTHKPDLRISGITVIEPDLIVTIANDCLGVAPSSRIKISVYGAASTAKPTPHVPLSQMEGDVGPIKAGGKGTITFSAAGGNAVQTWAGRSFTIEINSNGKLAEVSTANNTFIRSESGLDQAAFPVAKAACTAQ